MVTVPPARHVLTILAVDDLAASVRFYDAAFGWPHAVDAPVYVELALPAGMRLGFYAREGFARNTGGAPPQSRPATGETRATELYFHVDDLPAAIARLRKAGARELSALARRDWGDDAAYFADPDGNVLVVAAPAAL